MVLVATFQGTHCRAYTLVRMGCTLLLYLVKVKLPSLKPVYVGRFIAFNLMRSMVMFFRATPVMVPIKGHFPHLAMLALVLHSLVLASQVVWLIRTSVLLSAIRCKTPLHWCSACRSTF